MHAWAQFGVLLSPKQPLSPMGRSLRLRETSRRFHGSLLPSSLRLAAISQLTGGALDRSLLLGVLASRHATLQLEYQPEKHC